MGWFKTGIALSSVLWNIFVLYSMKTGFTNQNLIQAEEKLLYEVQGVVFAQRGEAELGKDNPEDLVL